MSYKIAAPDEYLAITGMGVRNEVKITKAAWVWPFQKCMRFRYVFELSFFARLVLAAFRQLRHEMDKLTRPPFYSLASNLRTTR